MLRPGSRRGATNMTHRHDFILGSAELELRIEPGVRELPAERAAGGRRDAEEENR